MIDLLIRLGVSETQTGLSVGSLAHVQKHKQTQALQIFFLPSKMGILLSRSCGALSSRDTDFTVRRSDSSFCSAEEQQAHKCQAGHGMQPLLLTDK